MIQLNKETIGTNKDINNMHIPVFWNLQYCETKFLNKSRNFDTKVIVYLFAIVNCTVSMER